MNVNELLARQIIHERVTVRSASRRPTHPKAARLLRRLADRVEGAT